MFKYDIPKKLYILFLGKIIMELGAYIWPLFTLMSVDIFKFSETQTASFLTIFTIFKIVGLIIGGKLTDTVGRRLTFSVFMGLSAFCYLYAGFVSGFYVIAALTIGGFFVSIGATAITPMIIDLCETEKQKNDAFTLYYIAMNLGFTLGPLIGGFLYDLGMVRFLFIGDGLTTLLFAILIFIFIPETLPDKDNYESKEGTKEAASNESIIKIIFNNEILLMFLVAIALLFLVFKQFIFGFSLHSKTFFEKPGTVFGIAMTINSAVVVLLTAPIIKLFEKMSITMKICVGGLFYAVGFGMLGFTRGSLSFFYLSVLIWTFGEILISPSTKVFIANHTPISHRGRFSSVFDLTRQLGGVLGLNIAGYVIQVYSIETMWIIMGAIAIAGSMILYKIYLLDKGVKQWN